MDENREPLSPSPPEEKEKAEVIHPAEEKTQVEKKPKCPLRKRILIIFGICVLLSVASFTSVAVADGRTPAEQRAFCKEVEAKEKTGKVEGHLNSKPSVQDIYMCHSLKCPFDTLKCEGPCPFSYELDEQDCPIGCECAGNGTTDADIRYDEDDVPVLLQDFGYNDDVQDFSTRSRTSGFQKWKRENDKQTGPLIITYLLDDDLTSEQKASWYKAISQLQEETCLRFNKHEDNERDYLFVTKTSGLDCNSFMGRKGGRQKIVMGKCFSPRHVEHLLMHALGFYHEHSRHDRDGYVKIQIENVLERHKRKFRKTGRRPELEYSTEFDKKSVTMFHGYSFSIEEGKKPTILDINTDQALVVLDKNRFSHNDIADINDVYCKDIKRSSDTDTPQTRSEITSDSAFNDLGDQEMPLTDFSWTHWGQWSKCDQTCGSEAVRRRYRRCMNEQGSTRSTCPGASSLTIPCKVVPCKHDFDLKPRWMPWGSFGSCSKTCGTGFRYRSRKCSDGKPDGGDCPGSNIHGKKCNTRPCRRSQYNRFDPWTQWSECSATCGGGKTTRYRECKSPSRRRSRYCAGAKVDNDGLQYQTKVCSTEHCETAYRSRSLDWFTDSEASKALEDPSWFFRSPNQIPSSICESNEIARWIVGDFNADGKNDILCKNSDGKVNIVVTDQANRLSKVTWQGNLDQCRPDQLYSGDFNGDGTTDVLCVVLTDQQAEMLIFVVRNGKPTNAVRVGDVCVGENTSLYIVDANSDGKDDIICRDKTIAPDKFSKVHLNVFDL